MSHLGCDGPCPCAGRGCTEYVTLYASAESLHRIANVDASSGSTVLASVLPVCKHHKYGYASDYKKSVHAKRFLNSWYFGGYGPRYGMLFRIFSAIRGYSPLFSDQNDRLISYIQYFLYSVAYP